MLVRLLQSKNALLPIDVTPSGITTLVRLVQSEKAPSPISVTLHPPSCDGTETLSSVPL